MAAAGDCWSKGTHHRRPHGDATATERVFVNADGVKRSYKFKPFDPRMLKEQALERQLKAAAFLPTTTEDEDAYSLTEGRAARTAHVPRAGDVCASLGSGRAQRPPL